MSNGARINILHVTNNLQIGGSEKYLVNLANAMNKDKFNCFVAYGGDSYLLNELNPDIKVIKISQKPLSFTPTSLSNIPRFVEIYRNYHIDIVQVHLFDSGLLASIAAKLNRIPVVHQIGGSLETRTKKQKIISKVPIVRKLIYESANIYTTGANYSVQELISKWHIHRSKIRMIHHGINIERFNPCVRDLRSEFDIDPATPIMGSVARLHPVKGISEAIRIFREDRKLINSKLFIVGDGKYRTEYEQLAINLGIGDDVIFTGFRSDIPEVMKTFDVYLHTQCAPLIGTTVLEAMGDGKPIVTLARNAEEKRMAMETIKPGVNGLIIPPDEKKAAKMICELLNDRKRLEEMGKQSRKIVEERFDFKDTVKKTEELYIELICSKNS